MEHPCYKCGASVEEGVPFCPQCGAPQIRVISPEPAVPEPPPSGVRQPPPPRISPLGTAHVLQFPEAWRAAGLGVLAGAVPLILLLGVPVGPAMLAAGFLSVVFYRRRVFALRLTAGVGARLGALSGALGFAVLGALVGIAEAVFHADSRVRQTITDVIQRSMARSGDPRAAEVVEFFKTPLGLVVAVFVLFLATLIFSGVGGALGAALLGRKDKL